MLKAMLSRQTNSSGACLRSGYESRRRRTATAASFETSSAQGLTGERWQVPFKENELHEER